jgi:hypothetical protein
VYHLTSQILLSFASVTEEKDLNTTQPKVTLVEHEGRINADLTLGVDVTDASALKANQHLSSPGVKLHGDGFIVTAQEASALGFGRIAGIDDYIKPYLHNRDLKARAREVMVIDLFGLSEAEVRRRFPSIWQRISETVKIAREDQVAKSPTKDAQEYLDKWWLFGKPREELRERHRSTNSLNSSQRIQSLTI